MKDRLRIRLRLTFEPNRFATEQLIKVYEVLKPLLSRTTAASSSSNPDRSKCSAAKAEEGKQ